MKRQYTNAMNQVSLNRANSLYVRVSHNLKVDNKVFNDLPTNSFKEKSHFSLSNNATISFDIEQSDHFQMCVDTNFSYLLTPKRFTAFSNLFKNVEGFSSGSRNVPGIINEFISENSSSWSNPGKRLLKLIRWRFNINLDLNGLNEIINISIDNIKWVRYYPKLELYATAHFRSAVVNTTEVIQKLLDDEANEPLAMDLLEEAVRLSDNNGRSALALAVSAMEVGTKDVITHFRFEAGETLNKMQSPPVEFLLSYLLPEIASRFKPDKEYINTIRNIVSARNNLIHKGEFKLTAGKLEEYLQFIKRLLYSFESLKGRDWADSYCRYRLVNLDNPK